MEFLQNIKKNYDEWTRITPQGLLYDRALFWLFVILLLIGLVAVTSASIPYSSRLFNDPFYFAKTRRYLCATFFAHLLYFITNFFFAMGKMAR